jgi:nitrous oxidase accessory protein NosD
MPLTSMQAAACATARGKYVTVWALPKSTLVRVRIAYVRLSIYVAYTTLDSQFSAVLLFTPLQL